MNNAKVTVTKEVAEAIEYKRNKHWNNYDIIHAYIDGSAGTEIQDFVGSSKGSFDALISALINGYTVEKSSEGKLLDYYDGLVETATDGRNDAETRELARYEASGVRQTLDILGIKIEGVNA